MNSPKTIHVCFVCLGNICRSPLAQGVFEYLVEQKGLKETILISSAGTGSWHVGKPPDARMQATAKKHGVNMRSRARQFQPEDFNQLDLVLAMDQSNRDDLKKMCASPAAEKKLRLFRSFDPECAGDEDVPDPYYGDGDGFDRVFGIVHRTCPEILKYITTELIPGR
ncbi:MAG: protein tyrosine phosphatase [Nitrospinae bacterium RIFCSPLOWO2_12_FULL_47_7]|nr:MAG: protein tyrosine phosphatase [Nitrospinae bacterium RIFCSPLOWO2_12_FULL_47_7]